MIYAVSITIAASPAGFMHLALSQFVRIDTAFENKDACCSYNQL